MRLIWDRIKAALEFIRTPADFNRELEVPMTVVLLLLTAVWFAFVIAIRIAALARRDGGVHATATPAIRHAAVYRKVLARKLHTHA